jgi:DNA-directed RNA polymerase subunit omega
MSNQITSEDAVNMVGNRYDLVLIASARARELRKGYAPKIDAKHHKPIVTALNEIEQGLIGREYLNKVKKPQKG